MLAPGLEAEVAMVKAVGEYMRGASEIPHHRTLVFVGAQTPDDATADAEGQCRSVWAKVEAALSEKNLGLRHIVAIETDIADRARLAAALAEQKRHVRHHVAQTTRVVGLADPDWLVQVSVVAAVTR